MIHSIEHVPKKSLHTMFIGAQICAFCGIAQWLATRASAIFESFPYNKVRQHASRETKQKKRKCKERCVVSQASFIVVSCPSPEETRSKKNTKDNE